MLYRFGEHEIDTARFELSNSGEHVELEPRVLKLLTFLIENRDRVVSRDELHTRLWGRRVVTENALSVCIRAARRAVDDSGDEQLVIKTIHGAGYQFVADVIARSRPYLDVHQPVAAEKEDELDGAVTFPDRARGGQPSIAIMPFETISGSASEDTLAKGLVHDVITRVARSRLMFVIARGTVFSYPAADRDVSRIGQALGVRYVVQGAVQVSSRRLQVSVALSNAMTRQEVWSEQYRRSIDDFMEVQEDIAEMITGALELRVEQEEVQRSLLMPSANLDAWSAYHRGFHHMYRFRFEECDKAEHFFRQSIDLEPTVPRPYAGLSFVHFERVFLGYEKNRAEGIHAACDYAEQSLAIDGLDPMGHWALARAQYLKGDFGASKASLETAIELNPSYAVAQYSLGWLAMQLGDHKLCKDKIELARQLSPLDPLMFAMLGVYALNLAMLGETREAAELSRKSLAQPNVHWQARSFAAITHALDGQIDKARELMRQVRAVAPGYDVKDFVAVFPFRERSDVRRVIAAFDRMRPADKT